MARIYELVAAEVATRRAANPSDPDLVIRVDIGDPGRFEEQHALGIGLAAIQVDPVDEQPLTRRIGSDNHDVDLMCVALSWSGDEDRVSWMTRAYALVDIVRDVLQANPGLGLDRVVETAWVDRTNFGWQMEGNYARKAIVEFAVRIRAYRSRRR